MADPKGAKAKYRVKNRVAHDGDVFEPGSIIELSAATAQPLLDVRAIEPAEKAS